MVKLRHLFLASAVFLALTGCRSDIAFIDGSFSPGQADVVLSGSNLSMNFPSSAGSASVDLDASGQWEASFVNDRAKEWCSLSKESGKRGKATITVTVKENTDYDQRSASIVFVCGDVQRTIVVTQKQKEAVLLTSNRIDMGAAGGSFTIEVMANITFDYTISDSARSWLSPVGTKGLAQKQILFKADVNESFEKREGEITFTSAAGSEVVHIYQEGDAPTLVVSAESVNMPSNGGEFEVQVRSNLDVQYTIPEECGWIQEVKSKAVSTNTFHFFVAENEGFEIRQAGIVFHNKEYGVSETVTVTQKDTAPVLVIGTHDYQFEPDGGSLSVELSSNMDLAVEIQPDCHWIVPVDTKAVTQRTLFFSVDKNHGRTDRSGWIAFKNSEQACFDTVRVSQVFQPILASFDTLEVSSRGGTVFFETVGADPADYSISLDDSWLYVSGTDRIGGRSRFYITALAQDEGAPAREDCILVYYKDFSEPDTLCIHQWKYYPSLSFTSSASIVTLPDLEGDNQGCFVDWGDGTQEHFQAGLSHRYSTSGLHTITIEVRDKKRVSFTGLSDGMRIKLRELRK